mmetsp:Transcript_25105/g.48890  ORF Transcript_25105/g.48890 Transcript_25105/m.48890 type:complete len:276 (-) Transcript_25105:272-1099(-)
MRRVAAAAKVVLVAVLGLHLPRHLQEVLLRVRPHLRGVAGPHKVCDLPHILGAVESDRVDKPLVLFSGPVARLPRHVPPRAHRRLARPLLLTHLLLQPRHLLDSDLDAGLEHGVFTREIGDCLHLIRCHRRVLIRHPPHPLVHAHRRLLAAHAVHARAVHHARRVRALGDDDLALGLAPHVVGRLRRHAPCRVLRGVMPTHHNVFRVRHVRHGNAAMRDGHGRLEQPVGSRSRARGLQVPRPVGLRCGVWLSTWLSARHHPRLVMPPRAAGGGGS